MSTPYIHNRTTSSDAPRGGERWRLNSAGQLVDATAAVAEWELADQLVKMNLNGEGGEDVRGQVRTPPNSKMATKAVAQLTETSPLETSSEASGGSSSPELTEQGRNLLHSRESSTDTTGSGSQASRTLRVPPLTPPQVGVVGEKRERPHSYSGGISTGDLRRLQQTGSPVAKPPSGETTPQQPQHQREWSGQSQSDQPTYPSLSGNPATTHRQIQPLRPMPLREADLEVDYQAQQRLFNPLGPLASPGLGGFGTGYPQPPSRPITGAGGFPYPNPQHQQPLSLGTHQQMYDMGLLAGALGHENPAVARVQQQHGVFRPTHQHSTSDPASLRDAATLAQLLAANNLQAFPAAPGMYPPLATPPLTALYANQFYTANDLAAAQAAQVMAAARLQSQYTGSYNGGLPNQNMQMSGSISPGLPMDLSPNGTGPSANNRKLGLYKTELCRSWEEKGTCRYGAKCQFAHGEDELRIVARHPKYKTEICRTFWVSGSCPYGKRCCFIHTELPASGAPPGADGTPPPTNLSSGPGRARSSSTNSDPNDGSTSLLARISAKRNQGSPANGSMSAAPTPVDVAPPANFSMGSRPGALRVDTSTIGSVGVSKENKSAYPAFPNGGMMHHQMPNAEQAAMSPIAMTAHPDMRRGPMDLNHGQPRLPHAVSPNNRHSFNGTEIGLDFSQIAAAANATTPTNTFGPSPPQVHATPRANGHVRAGSAGNWPQTFRSSRLSQPSQLSAVPGNELKNPSPWATSELAIGSSRLA